MKSVKQVCAKVKEQTLSIFKPVKNEEVVQRVNKILVGWGNYFQCGYPRKAFDKVNWYVRNRLYLTLQQEEPKGLCSEVCAELLLGITGNGAT